MILKLLVCFVAGAGAGLGTGFAGMSAAAVISPMLIVLLKIPAYQAVGISLASDVLASAVSAYTYGKNKHLDIKNGIVMMVSVLVMTLIGSWLAKFLPNIVLGNFTILMMLVMGVRFILNPVNNTRKNMDSLSLRRRVAEAIACGCVIGFICGFIGAGGGLMMLFVLTSVLGYELKTAIGTSVFIMSFSALTGSASHMIIGGLPDVTCLIFCVVFTFLWARIAARIANRATAKVLNRTTGIVLLSLGVFIGIVSLI